MGILAGFLFLVILVFGTFWVVVLSTLFNGWVLSILWGWFMVPTFGLPTLSMPQAMGIALVVSYLTYHYNGVPAQEKEKTKAEKIISVSMPILRPLFTLGFGWVIHQYM